MSQLISYLPQTADSCGLKAIAPIIGQTYQTVKAANGATPADLFLAVASGSAAFAAGQISNDGCAFLEVSLTYLNGSDCNSCTVDSISTTVSKVIVPPFSVFPLPAGLVSAATYTTGSVDGTGAFTASNVTKAQTIGWYSNYQPCCDGFIAVP